MENCWDFLKSITFKAKTVCYTFLATFWEIGLLLVLSSGHTGSDASIIQKWGYSLLTIAFSSGSDLN